MVCYSDPKKAEKLEQAIKLGYIIRSRCEDGVLQYKLTNKGHTKWLVEKLGLWG